MILKPKPELKVKEGTVIYLVISAEIYIKTQQHNAFSWPYHTFHTFQKTKNDPHVSFLSNLTLAHSFHQIWMKLGGESTLRCPNQYVAKFLLVCFCTPRHSGGVRVLGQCQVCLLIQVVFPVILSSQCKHLQLFTVKCPPCSPSPPVCFHHYSTWCTYCIVLPRCSGRQPEVTGRVTPEVIVSREKINADWSRHDSLSESSCHRGTCQAELL